MQEAHSRATESMSDTATTVALFAACASSLSASLVFIAVRMAADNARARKALADEFWKQSVQQADENIKQWRAHQSAMDSHLEIRRALHLAFPEKFSPVFTITDDDHQRH